MEKTSKSASDYLQGLGSIIQQVGQLKELNQHFKQYIAPEIAEYCFVTRLVNHKLTVLTASGSIATQIRFESFDLLRKFKGDAVLKEVKQIETKVRPQQAPGGSHKKTKKVAKLSTASSEIIESIAESIDDEKLKKALLRIASYI